MDCNTCSKEPEHENELPGPRPASERGCTDLLCLILFAVFWVGMICIMGVSVANGDIDAITYGADYKGNRCGRGDFVNRSKTVYPRIEEDLFEQRQFILDRRPWLIKLYGLCVEECVDENDVKPNEDGVVTPVAVTNYNYAGDAAKDKQDVWPLYLPEVELLNRCFPYANVDDDVTEYCFDPDCKTVDKECALRGQGDKRSWEMKSQEDRDLCRVAKDEAFQVRFYPAQQSALQEYITGQLGSFLGFIESLNQSKTQIAVSAIVFTFVMCYVWMFSMRYVAKIVVYTMIFLLFAVLTIMCAVTFTYSCFIRDDSIYNCTKAEQRSLSYNGVSLESTDVFRAGFFVCLFLWIVFSISLCRLGNAIETCVAIVRESSVVVAAMPMLMLIPLGATCLVVGVLLYFLYIGVYIATAQAGTYEEFQDQFNQAGGYAAVVGSDPTYTQYALFSYHLFGTLWSLSFIVGAVMMVVAGGVSQWFFFRDNAKFYSPFPILTSLKTVVRFHLGTVAFGSLIIAIAQFLRIVLEYVDQRTKQLQDSNLVARLVLKCVKCCMWCLEKCLKFITGYAYIYTAIEGLGFCNAAKSTFVLIMKYPAQLYINHLVQFVLKLLQSITIPFISGLICYYWVNADGNPNAGYCAVITIIISFFLTRIFGAVYEVIIESIFVCSFRDRDMYDAAHTPQTIRNAFGMGSVTVETKPLAPKPVQKEPPPPAAPAPPPPE
mmetsp:Transcript_20538/g.55280  ORF Transcript_20538/g.55280 Transcript_20538/m.55280 type:complete len:717 (-) Transcript_20538:312-2462(-)